jgi:hypothetical protein
VPRFPSVAKQQTEQVTLFYERFLRNGTQIYGFRIRAKLPSNSTKEQIESNNMSQAVLIAMTVAHSTQQQTKRK